MPTYSYQCSSCDLAFELRQGYDAESEQPCPRCRNTAKRTFHPVGVIYRGSGFYTTDYRKTRGDGPNGSHETDRSGDSPTESSKSSGSSKSTE